ncbi:MAG: threonine--tRNA ligase, partial [Acholeplasmataceae bacterium]|nr:threonine--tRNA ligase [Acholeplasmataceae bacterium]
VHRYEASGALNGLFRVRAFTQDDAHIYMRKDQIVDEIVHLIELFDEIYQKFNLSYTLELSTRPLDNFIGEIKLWDESEQALKDACEKIGKGYKLNPGDGAFYGPKLDFKIKDSMNRVWQCGTIQLDMNLPERFELFYIDDKGDKQRPIMLHRAIFGSVERFIGILIEHYAGAFPTWLAPTQVMIIPVNNQYHLDHSLALLKQFKDQKIRVKLDQREEKLGYKIREAQTNKIPYQIVIGNNEVKEDQVTYRKYGQTEQITVTRKEFLSLIKNEIDNKIN